MLEVIDEISRKNKEANKLLPKFRKIDRTRGKAELVCTKTDEAKYGFNRFVLPFKFIEKIHSYETTLDEAIEDQVELEILINKLSTDYNPRSLKEKRREKLCFRICKKIV